MKLAQAQRAEGTRGARFTQPLVVNFYRFLLHPFPFYELDPDRPVGEEQRVVDLVHSLADRVLEAVAAEEGGEQHVEVLLGESVS